MFEIPPATQVSFDQLHQTMLDAFSDYAVPMQLSLQGFEMMMRQRGLDLESSRVAIVDGDVAAVWLTSIRGDKGYLISSGTRPQFRSRGLARAMAKECLGHLRGLGIRSFQCEVLRDNETAAGLYYSLGMTQNRLLDCFSLPILQQDAPGTNGINKIRWQDIAEQVDAVRDWTPSWQNDDDSMLAIADQLLCLASYDGAKLQAYAVVSPQSGTVHQLAVHKLARGKGLGKSLLTAVQRQLPETPLRLINVQQDDRAFQRLMASLGATETAGQYELLSELQ